jgi:hypothetical protein
VKLLLFWASLIDPATATLIGMRLWTAQQEMARNMRGECFGSTVPRQSKRASERVQISADSKVVGPVRPPEVPAKDATASRPPRTS